MKDKLSALLSELGIEYFATLAYSACRETAPHIMEREAFTPRSVIIYLLPYYGGECVNLSRYAASLDYHLAINLINSAISKLLVDNLPGVSLRGYAALIAGLGVAGDNGLIINEKYGSYVFVGDMVTDIPPEQLGAVAPKPILRCEGCGACKRACPTGILRGEGVSCLSEITQRKGELSEREAELMRKYNTAWGCDLCQSSCPHNASPRLSPIGFFLRDRIAALTEERIAGMSKRDFRSRAFGWRGRAVVERNLRILSGDEKCTKTDGSEA